ncbi:MAG: putative DNA binding domain-containing protein [Atopobiaceae bacterium]|nr:putative DNA binding domain-containing protein [Atopobiaceae bacterium]
MRDQDLVPIVEKLRSQHTDDEYVEVKACAQEISKAVWDTVSAFANTNGGLILLGIDEKDDFKPVRHFAIDKVLDQFVTGMGDGDPYGARIAQPPAYHPHRLTFEGSPVLAIEVEELGADKKPCFITGRGVVGGSYKRVDDKDVRLSPTEVYALTSYFTPSHADRRIVESATIADLSPEFVNGIIEHAKNSRALRGTKTREEKMSRLNIVNDAGGVSLAGLLVCGNYPQQYFPKLVIDVAVHPGIQKSDPASTTRFLDREICEGSIGEVIDTAYRAIVRNLRTYSIVKEAGRTDRLEIPEEVIREALANAVVHREYGEYFEGQAVSVDVYPDRIEIINPGGLWGGKTKENIGDGTSACRNASLMKLMSMLPLPGGDGVPVEGNGSGVPLMRSAMTSRALAEPEFDPRIDSFRLVLGRGGTEIAENQQWLTRAVTHDLGAHERAIAVMLHREGNATVADVRSQLGIDSDEIRSAFKALVSEGVLKWAGKDEVKLVTTPRWSREEWHKNILAILDPTEPMGIHDIATALGKRPESTRRYVRQLIDSGNVIATAPPSSTDRKYLLKHSTLPLFSES